MKKKIKPFRVCLLLMGLFLTLIGSKSYGECRKLWQSPILTWDQCSITGQNNPKCPGFISANPHAVGVNTICRVIKKKPVVEVWCRTDSSYVQGSKKIKAPMCHTYKFKKGDVINSIVPDKKIICDPSYAQKLMPPPGPYLSSCNNCKVTKKSIHYSMTCTCEGQSVTTRLKSQVYGKIYEPYIKEKSYCKKVRGQRKCFIGTAGIKEKKSDLFKCY